MLKSIGSLPTIFTTPLKIYYKIKCLKKETKKPSHAKRSVGGDSGECNSGGHRKAMLFHKTNFSLYSTRLGLCCFHLLEHLNGTRKIMKISCSSPCATAGTTWPPSASWPSTTLSCTGMSEGRRVESLLLLTSPTNKTSQWYPRWHTCYNRAVPTICKSCARYPAPAG